MKKNSAKLLALVFSLSYIFGCQSSSSAEEFEEANGGDVARKLVKTFNIVSSQNSTDNQSIELTYTTDGKLNTIANDGGTSIFVYDNSGSLETITGTNSNLDVADVYQSPYDAFDQGEVLEYDQNSNPYRILFYDEEYDYNTHTYVTREYIAEITYDDAPNPFFHTLEAGGIIDVLDQTQLNFSANPQSPDLVQARLLLPLNNPSQIVYRDENDQVAYTINFNYVYDADNYPTSATITAVGNSESNVFSATYTYVD